MSRGHSTDDLIEELARRPVPLPFQPGRAAWAVALAASVAVGAFWLVLGLRPDLAAALAVPVILAKSLLPLALAALALWFALASARPAVRLRIWVLALPAGLAVLLFAQRLVVVPDGQMLPELLGQTAAACLLSISTLSLLPTAIGMVFLRHGAPTRPVLSGALLGLAAGAGVAAGYALHCTEDSPLFFVLWYGLGIAISAGLGAVAGRRFLRW